MDKPSGKMRAVNDAGRSTSPEVQSSTYVTILDAAEQTFGLHGFDGGSMREIAQVAGIAQSLLHYHFKNKDALYEAVFERRAAAIREVRRKRLEEVLGAGSKVSLEDVLGVLFLPLEDLLGAKREDLKYYVRMLAELTISANERSIEIVKRLYDPAAEQFVHAFQQVLPALGRERAVWAYLFAIGARMQAHAPSDRAVRLGVTKGPRWSYSLLIPFVAAGIRAIATEDTSPAP